MSTLERALVIVAFGCLLAAAATPPVLRVVSPRDAAHADFLRDAAEVIHGLYLDEAPAGGAVDPWGRPFRARALRPSEPPGTHLGVFRDGGPATQRPRPVYSTGPDGVDDGGRGDDLHLELNLFTFRCALLALAPGWVGGLALLLVWLAAWVRRRRRTLAGEVAVVVVMCAPLLASVPVALWQLEQLGVAVPDLPLVVLPARVAVVTSASLLSLLVCVGIRLAGPRPAAAAAAPS